MSDMQDKVVVCRDRNCKAHASLERARAIAVSLEQEVAELVRERDEALARPVYIVPRRLSWWERLRERRQQRRLAKHGWPEGWREIGYTTDDESVPYDSSDPDAVDAEVLCGSTWQGHDCCLPDGHEGVHFCGSDPCWERWPAEYPDDLPLDEHIRNGL